jgi:hypothetical protein
MIVPRDERRGGVDGGGWAAGCRHLAPEALLAQTWVAAAEGCVSEAVALTVADQLAQLATQVDGPRAPRLRPRTPPLRPPPSTPAITEPAYPLPSG